MAILSDLNAARHTNGKAPLTSWKASKAALDEAYAKERAQNPNYELEPFEAPAEEIKQQAVRPKHDEPTVSEHTIKLSEIDPKVAERVARVKSSAKNISLKIVGYKKPSTRLKKEAMHADPRPTKEIMKTIGDTFTLADLARELNIDPKLARVKARRHLKQTNGAWVFTADQRDYVTQVLQSDHRKK